LPSSRAPHSVTPGRVAHHDQHQPGHRLLKPCTAEQVLDAIARVLGEAHEAGT
jgi:hypothetical protein